MPSTARRATAASLSGSRQQRRRSSRDISLLKLELVVHFEVWTEVMEIFASTLNHKHDPHWGFRNDDHSGDVSVSKSCCCEGISVVHQGLRSWLKADAD
jgi:hypothetical protein